MFEEETNTTATLEPQQETSAIEELNRLAQDTRYADTEKQADQYLSDSLGITHDATEAIQRRTQGYHRCQGDIVGQYLRESRKPTAITEDFFYVLNGWDYDETSSQTSGALTTPAIHKYLLPEQYRRTTGGYFLRWNGTGIAINPGYQFLKNFHAHGLHVQDIDFVVVTRDNPEAYAEIKAIYDLNYQLNMNGADLHIIHYYLNQQAHRTTAAILKPNFKQERNTVHCLELFVDSPDVESVTLTEGITLDYFPTQTQDTRQTALDPTGLNVEKGRSVLGAQLTLTKKDPYTHADTQVTIGYVAGTAWSPLMASHLTGCDILVTGMENTSADDYGKMKYNPDSLGYFGTYSLMEQVRPKILLICEFGARQGDIRMETAKKMRQEYAYENNQNTVILPGDTGLCVDLAAMQICCEVTEELVAPTQVRVVKCSDSFGNLRYLSPSCFI